MHVSIKLLVKWAQNEDFGDLMRLRLADSKASVRTDEKGRVLKKDFSVYNRMFNKWKKARQAWEKDLVSGDMIQKILKIKSGPHVGNVIREMKVKQVQGVLKNKRDAEKYLRKLAMKSVDKVRKSLDKRRF
jgi:hypothetical protein